MRFINPNQFEKIRHSAGFKNPEDIWDIETFNEIKQEIKQLAPNIKELIFEEKFTIETKRCLEKTRTFCGELSEDFKQNFLTLIGQYRQERRQISEEIVNYLLEKNFVLPNLIIADREQAQVLLKEYEIDKNIKEQNLLLVFQLPKPLAQF